MLPSSPPRALAPLHIAPLLIGLLLAGATDAIAQTRSGAGTLSAEATIYENENGNNGGGYGDVCIGNLMTGFMTRRGLVRYDLPDIPEGSTVTRVVLDLQQDRVRDMGTGPKAATLQVRRITSDWTEGFGSGGRAACGGGGAVPGVDWDSQPSTVVNPSATAALSTNGGFSVTLDSASGGNATGLLADVQAWVDGAPNQGWMFSARDEDTPDNARLLDPGALTVEWTESEGTPFTINAGLNDAWFNPTTSGQGFFFTVFPDAGIFFLAWFTYDVERPDDSTVAVVGEPGHRWITAQGPFDGDTAELEATLTFGGAFDAGQPAPQRTTQYGTLTVAFADCDAALVSYAFPGLSLAGEVPVERVVKDNVALCEALQGPADSP